MRITKQEILMAVCKYYNTSPARLFTDRRLSDIVEFRKMLIYLCYVHNYDFDNRSMIEFFRNNGMKTNKTHASIIYAINKIKVEREIYSKLKIDIQEIEDLILNGCPLIPKNVDLLSLTEKYSATI